MQEFKIPKSFMLFGQQIDVIFVDDLVDKEDSLGQARFRKNQIALQRKNDGIDRSLNQIGQTFCHELVHYIFNEMNENELRDNEKIVDVFASLLHQSFVTMEFYHG